MRRWLIFLSALGGLSASAGAEAVDASRERKLSPREIETWLAQPGGMPASDSSPEPFAEAPPPRPRARGIIVESGIGAMGHLGPLAHVSPLAPWFHLKAGFEPLRWLMAFAETDLVFSNTSYAHAPPPARTYRLYGFGGGVRSSLAFGDRFGAYLEGSVGVSAVTGDVLEVYGYRQANELNLYFGGRLGAEWYPINPHLALGVHFGARSFQEGLHRERSQETALALMSGAAIRYTF